MKIIKLTLYLIIFSALNLNAQNFSLTREQWKSDLVRLRDELPQRHPRPFQFITAEEYRSAFDALIARLGNMSDAAIALEAQAIVSRLRDNQTRLELSKIMQREKVIPVGWGEYADGLYISGTVMRFKEILGRKVVKINGMEPDEVLRRLARYTSAENEAALKREGWLYLRFPLVFRQLGISDTDTLTLTIENSKGVRRDAKIYPFDFKAAPPEDMVPAQFNRENPDLRYKSISAMYFVNWLEADSIVYLQYNSAYSREWAVAAGDSTLAGQLPPFEIFADTAVAMMRQWPGARFFLDLRFNPGGWAQDGKILADRLAALPGVNDPDKLFVAVNAYTGLAAVEIAEYFGSRTNATVLGQAPAQWPGHSGEVRSFGLPNSQIEVYYSLEFPQITPKTPKYLAIDREIPLSFEDFRKGKDPLLEYVRKMKMEK